MNLFIEALFYALNLTFWALIACLILISLLFTLLFLCYCSVQIIDFIVRKLKRKLYVTHK
jgi:antibiotic biosynthesis monooxygenase (ABM) superfamily enzyme